MSNKGALALLMDYDGDTSDDEVPGCRVSTKRTQKDDSDLPNPKRPARLPLPSFALSSPANEHTDDPELHEGRTRSFPHERGNWASFVYLPCKNEQFKEVLELVLSSMHMLPAGLQPNPIRDLHFSLSRTVILKHHWIESFVQTIKQNLSGCQKLWMMLGEFKVYCNEERTRTFLAIDTMTGCVRLIQMVQTVDQCFAEYNLPPFYDNPSFHMSVGWWLGDREEELSLLLPEINRHRREVLHNSSLEKSWSVCMTSVVCKTGNKLFEIQLN